MFTLGHIFAFSVTDPTLLIHFSISVSLVSSLMVSAWLTAYHLLAQQVLLIEEMAFFLAHGYFLANSPHTQANCNLVLSCPGL